LSVDKTKSKSVLEKTFFTFLPFKLPVPKPTKFLIAVHLINSTSSPERKISTLFLSSMPVKSLT